MSGDDSDDVNDANEIWMENLNLWISFLMLCLILTYQFYSLRLSVIIPISDPNSMSLTHQNSLLHQFFDWFFPHSLSDDDTKEWAVLDQVIDNLLLEPEDSSANMKDGGATSIYEIALLATIIAMQVTYRPDYSLRSMFKL